MLIHKGHGTRIEARREIQTEKEKKKIIHKSPETRIEIRRGTGKEERIKRKIGEKMREKQEKKGRKTEERRSTEPGKAQDDIEATTTDAPILTMTFPIMMTTNTTITSPGSDTPGMIWMSSIEGRGLLTAIIGVEDHLLIDSMIVEDPRLDTEPPIIDGLVTMIITIGTTEVDATMTEMTGVETVTATLERMRLLGSREPITTCDMLTDARKRKRRCIDRILTDIRALPAGTLSTLNCLLEKKFTSLESPFVDLGGIKTLLEVH